MFISDTYHILKNCVTRLKSLLNWDLEEGGHPERRYVFGRIHSY